MTDDYAWIELGNGRQVYRRIRHEEIARSNLPCPQLITDIIPETQSMVDGKYYSSKSELRATYKPSGNQAGERYVEIGNEELKPAPKPKPNRKSIRDSVEKAFSRAGIS